jgi:hypothetical protein
VCTGTSLTLSAVADAWLEQNSPTNNKGSDSILKVKSQRVDNFRALVRFATPQLPAGCRLVRVTLRLYADGSRTGRTLVAAPTNSSWSESSVNWRNQPQPIAPGVGVPSASGFVTWDLTPVAGSIISSGVAPSFVIMDSREDVGNAEQSFFAREKRLRPPQLVLHFAP